MPRGEKRGIGAYCFGTLSQTKEKGGPEGQATWTRAYAKNNRTNLIGEKEAGTRPGHREKKK